uniref:Helicase C-terminal domain-containing protein n=1 Tax=Thermosporothrix sp. COM3 TaxID=2490863 RepID=A0A455SLZ9_9CHLR|nr:hypothetical protein KTC_19660 [Thermosporothrix sp. COM3]
MKRTISDTVSPHTIPASVAQTLACIELVQQLRETQRPPTPEEQALLSQFMGWGALAPAFEPTPREHWQEIAARLRLVLGPEGFAAASAATPTSYFTDAPLIRALWHLAEGLGFTGGRVLEPGCGSGAVLAAAPPQLSLSTTGIERDPFSAALAQLRCPQARILCTRLEQVIIPAHSYDLVIGNVPFGKIPISDRETGGHRFPLHTYFLWRALQALRPGGLALLITSRYTLDASSPAHRAALAEQGYLLGALRLPAGAHRAAATEVVSDLLILQKRAAACSWQGSPWLQTTEALLPGLALNEYFAHQMLRMVGTPALTRNQFGDPTFTLRAPQPFEAALEQAVCALIEEITAQGGGSLPPHDYTRLDPDLLPQRADGRQERSYHLLDGRLVQVLHGELVPITRMSAELTALVQLREATRELLEAERDLDRPDETLLPLRQQLNTLYDAYVASYGPLHRATLIQGTPDPETGEPRLSRRRPAALAAFAQDPDAPLVLGLERYDAATQHAEKAPLFFERVHARPQRKTTADTPAEALALCLDECGRLDLAVIARLLSLPVEQVPAALGDLIYEDPVRGGWLPASEYLSGQVAITLEQARAAAKREPARFQRNVTALEAIQPEPLLPEEITVRLGAPWIPPRVIAQFCRATFGAFPQVSHVPVTGTWHVWVEKSATTTPAATSAWGTARLHAYALLEAGLNKKAPVVYDLTPDGTSVKNSEETLAAQEKLRAIEARFAEWIWDDVERARELAAIYHRTYTAWVPRHDDGAHLSFPGMSARWQTQLYPWQRDFVWRMVTSPAALCAHPVGAGKTTTEIAGAMTLRRLGLVRKPAILVPNHLLEQITAEAQQLYPGAQILMVSREELSREKRPLFAARLATGTWDLVVLTHSGFAALGVHPDTEARFLEARVTAYREALLSLEREPHEQEDRAARRSIKQLETQVERMRQRQQALQERPHDGGVTFEQLGIDYLIVDEAHLYKNLGLPSNLPALQVRPSTRACDLEMKLRWLQAHNEGRPFAAFFTATPLSNSMVEAFVWGWYLRPELLRAWGLETVDAFASCFIDFETRVEVSPNGASFRLFRRPARFLNLPEFLALFSQFADLRSPELLHGLRPSRIERTIVVEPDADTQAFVDTLVERSEAIQRGSPQWIAGRLDNMLWVTTHGRMAALDLSLVGERAARSPKLEAVAAQMLAVYERWQREAAFLPGAFKSLQIGFCDLGTPNAQDDKLYGTLRRLLIAGGIPAHGIRFIHEATTDQQKAHLFEQCRNGQVAILLGSTAKLGTGTNIQTRAAALHHLDAPWRPDEVEQREGRVCRPGNLYPQVELFRYVQERTFDAYSWQVLTTKAVFFDQVRAGRLSERTTEELGAHALSYGQVKAAATGDPLVLEQAESAEVLAQLLRLQQAHRRARARDAHEAEQARAAARRTRIEAHQLAAIARQAEQAPAGLRLPSGQLLTAREEIAEFIALRVLHQLTQNKGWENLGHWQDCECAVRLRQQERRYTIDLLFGSSDSAPCVSLASTWLAQGQRWRIVEALTRFTATAAAQAERLRETAERLEARAARFAAQAAEPFARQEELHRVRARQQALDRYTHLVAEAKEQPEKAAEAARLRASLLAESTSHTAAVTASPIPTETPAALLPPRVPATLPASGVQTTCVASAQVSTAEATVPVAPEVPAVSAQEPPRPPTRRRTGGQRPRQKASRATTPASARPRTRRRAAQGAPSGPAGETTPAPTTTSAQTEQRPPVIPGSRATLVFGNPEHIQQVRAASQRKPRSSRRQTEQASTSAGAGHRAQSTPAPQQAQRSVARIRTPSSQATEHAAAAQQQHPSHHRSTDAVPATRVSPVFGHPEHVQRLRKPSPRRSRRRSAAPASEHPTLFTFLPPVPGSTASTS